MTKEIKMEYIPDEDEISPKKHSKNMSDFAHALKQHRLWHILPSGESDPGKSKQIYDTQHNMLLPGRAWETALQDFLNTGAFFYVRTKKGTEYRATLHSKTRLLWRNTSEAPTSVEKAQEILRHTRFSGLAGWRLPTKPMLETFAKSSGNPHWGDCKYRLKTAQGVSNYNWLTVTGRCDVDEGCWGIDNHDGYVFACNPCWDTENVPLSVMLCDLAERGWLLQSVSVANAAFDPSLMYAENVTPEALLAEWVQQGVSLQAEGQKSATLNPHDFWLPRKLALLDYIPCRLPELDQARLSDHEQGVWELWGQDPAALKPLGLVARDPIRDVQKRAVAIDFGTSSTVVAMDSRSGARELLRIGVRDFYQAAKAQDFENPTVLECVDYPAFAQAWCAKAYRPELDWDWMRAAHEARTDFRNGNAKLSSFLPILKQWALRTNDQRKRLTDQQTPAHEQELAAHTERNPVRGEPLKVSPGDAFDPIELYAWYLGMAINWRGHGLFLKYYLSFPVKYPSEVKERILASFRRGLQRSLPQTLIEHHPQVLGDFEVNDLATEPAAYAAAALPHLGVEPSDEGVPYAVFDFGGGTSDFDYGLLRWATPEEEDAGYERVFEHLGSSGDNFLGGENLLEHLVYDSFKKNLPMLREKRIQFTQPIDAEPFTGSEAFLSRTLAAQTNAIVLAAKLRGFLEGDKAELTSTFKLDLMDVNGTKPTTCEMEIDAKVLDALLAKRMRRGAEAFLAELARLRPALPEGAPIHVLLSGNGSRSRHIKALFDVRGPLWPELLATAFGEGQVPEIVVHAPLPMDEGNHYAPTAKTGVALGLLRLAPGENTLLKNHLHQAHDGEAPFAWFAGRMRRGQFEPGIAPGAVYGEWRELGVLQQGVFNLYTTSSPRAHALKEGDPELRKHRLNFPAAAAGAHVFARAVKPHAMELAAAPDKAALGGVVPLSFRLE